MSLGLFLGRASLRRLVEEVARLGFSEGAVRRAVVFLSQQGEIEEARGGMGVRRKVVTQGPLCASARRACSRARGNRVELMQRPLVERMPLLLQSCQWRSLFCIVPNYTQFHSCRMSAPYTGLPAESCAPKEKDVPDT